MKLQLIAPASQSPIRIQKKVLSPPLGLAMVAALTPPEVEISLIDENVMAIDFQKEVDLVGITVTTLTAARAYEIADTFRARGVKVVMGGPHPSALPEEASQYADAVVVGEAEGVWPSLIEDLKANRLKSIYSQKERLSLDGLPIPRRDLLPKGAYWIPEVISTTRGCPYNCSFCSVTSFFGHTYRSRPLEEIRNEIETLNGRKLIFFVDDNIVGNPKFAKELFRTLIPYKINWLGQASVTIARDKELLELAAASGCRGLMIGFESLSPASLATIGKRVNAAEEYEQVVKDIHSHGIGIHGFFMFGLDNDNEGVFEATVRFAQKIRLESAKFNSLTPFPGTALYDSLDKAGRIITKEWSKYYDEIVFEPKLMSREALRKGNAWASREFFSLPSIWRRIGIRHHNLTWLWAINLSWRARYRKHC